MICPVCGEAVHCIRGKWFCFRCCSECQPKEEDAE
jgi:hypothetical protein